MNKRRVYLYSLIGLLLSFLSTAGFAGYMSVAQERRTQQAFAGDPYLKEVANYRKWTRVNEVPIPVSHSLVSGATLVGASFFAGD